MIDLRQKELNAWEIKNFGVVSVEDMALGMSEEVGELCHALLKQKQSIRLCESNDNFESEIIDSVCDAIIYGIQLLSLKGVDVESELTRTIFSILKRDWRNRPKNGINH